MPPLSGTGAAAAGPSTALERGDQVVQLGHAAAGRWRIRPGSYTFMLRITQSCDAFVKGKVAAWSSRH